MGAPWDVRLVELLLPKDQGLSHMEGMFLKLCLRVNIVEFTKATKFPVAIREQESLTTHLS